MVGKGFDEKESVAGGVPMQLLDAGNTIVRFENETQMAIAIQRPRNLIKIRDMALAELEAFPDMAEDVVYLAPVGKQKVKDKDGRERWEQQYAEELNIRAAENLFRIWGNAATGAVPISEDDDKVSFMTVYTDYETNGRLHRFGYAAKKYKDRNGRIQEVAPDRFAKTTLPGAISRVLRETILRSLPHGLKQAYKAKAYEIFGKKYTPEECRRLWPKMVAGFEELGVDAEQLGIITGKPDGKKMTARDYMKAQTIFRQLKSGETVLAELVSDPLEATKASLAKELADDPFSEGRHTTRKKKPAPAPEANNEMAAWAAGAAPGAPAKADGDQEVAKPATAATAPKSAPPAQPVEEPAVSVAPAASVTPAKPAGYSLAELADEDGEAAMLDFVADVTSNLNAPGVTDKRREECQNILRLVDEGGNAKVLHKLCQDGNADMGLPLWRQGLKALREVRGALEKFSK